MSGAVIGGFFAVLILIGYEQKITGRRLFRKDKLVWRLPERALLRRFLIEGGLLTIFSGLLILFQLADSFIIKDALESYGLAEPLAKAAKGIYDRGQPLVQLGLVVASALSASFLPLLTKNFSRQEAGQFIRSGKIYLRITLALSLAASLGLALLLPYVNYALFKDYAGNSTLILFVFAIALMAQIQAYQSIAQSQNHFRASLKGAGWGFLVKLLLTRWLTTLMGTVGASLATLAGLSVVLFYLQAHADSRLKGFSKERHFGRRLFISLAVMFLVVITYYGVLQIVFGTIEHRSQALLASLAGVLFGGTSFIYCAIQTRLFTIREWLLLPFGKKILNFRKQGH